MTSEGSVRARAIAPWLRKAWVGYRAASHRGRMKMRCLECGSEAVTERAERTAQGYRRFRCRACGKQFNERSGILLNRTQYPSDVIALVVLWRLRYKLSLRDLPEMFILLWPSLWMLIPLKPGDRAEEDRVPTLSHERQAVSCYTRRSSVASSRTRRTAHGLTSASARRQS